MADLPGAAEARLPQQPYNNLRRTFPGIGEAGLGLLNGLLTYDPTRRTTAAAALQHPYFSERPYPKQPQAMPTFPSSHEPGYKGALQPMGPRAALNPYDSPPRGAGGGQQHYQQQQQRQQGGAARRAPPAPEVRGRGVDEDGQWGAVFGGEGRDAKRRRGGGGD
jgi:hypothetical protein